MPKFDLSCTFSFAASHFLTQYHGKCEALHGHNYKLIVTITGEVRDDGMVMDFIELKKIVNEKVIDRLDHTNLNDFFDNPSSENIAIWIWDELKDKLPLKKIAIYETENSCCEYYGS